MKPSYADKLVPCETPEEIAAFEAAAQAHLEQHGIPVRDFAAPEES